MTPKRTDYDNAAQFDQSDYCNWWWLNAWRVGFSMFILCNCLMTFFLNTNGIMHMVYYFSYWGSISTMFGIIFSIKACQDKKRWQFWACFMSQLGMGFNFVIMPFFWMVLAP